MPQCYIAKSGYQLEYEKPLQRGMGVTMAVFSFTYFLNDPILEDAANTDFERKSLCGGTSSFHLTVPQNSWRHSVAVGCQIILQRLLTFPK